jgi:LmbE family N-acetylglucosaminyl deacetylase
VLVAHPDDETVGCGSLLQRMSDPIVAFATDGAPRSDYFWKSFGSRASYARVRASEAEQALAFAGVAHSHFLCEDEFIADQELFRSLGTAYKSLAELIECDLPDAILTHAYEGGHPDHDACSFLASLAGHQYEFPVWEMPLYHRAGGAIGIQSFIHSIGEIEIQPSIEEHELKRQMFSAHASQAHVLGGFPNRTERFRPMLNYDFTRAPHPGVLNYEAWQWPMKGYELCQAFTEFLKEQPGAVRKRQWGTVA